MHTPTPGDAVADATFRAGATRDATQSMESDREVDTPRPSLNGAVEKRLAARQIQRSLAAWSRDDESTNHMDGVVQRVAPIQRSRTIGGTITGAEARARLHRKESNSSEFTESADADRVFLAVDPNDRQYQNWLRKVKLGNPASETNQQLFENRAKTVQEYVSLFKKGGMNSKLPDGAKALTVEQGLQAGEVENVNVRKLLTDLREKFNK